ncbi:MAG: OsmC family protein [Thermoanaerobaculum sp.]|nr:OsmC family protein [Thermoanaerobaculum sp.]MDW7968473.1 OsmC family protein [Thermoanaerobaculum sp.]
MSEPTRAVLRWQGGLRFEAESGSGKTVVVDSPARPDHAGPSPMELLLIGVAGCTGMDVAAILEKMRQPLARLEVVVLGQRAETNPKYFTAITLEYHLWGHGLEEEKVRRAVELSHQTYCSALASLRPDCRVESHIHIHAP